MTQKSKNKKNKSPQSIITPAVILDTSEILEDEPKNNVSEKDTFVKGELENGASKKGEANKDTVIKGELKKSVKDEKRSAWLAKANYVWTSICTVYVFISTIILVSRGWVDSVASYVLICFLAVYLLVFIIISCLSRKNKKRSAKQLSYYKKLLAMFKLIANLMFLVISATTLVGVSGNGENVVAWVVFILTFITVSVQLVLKISIFVMKIKRKQIGKRYTVKTYRYINGEGQSRKMGQKIKERTYK